MRHTKWPSQRSPEPGSATRASRGTPIPSSGSSASSRSSPTRSPSTEGRKLMTVTDDAHRRSVLPFRRRPRRVPDERASGAARLEFVRRWFRTSRWSPRLAAAAIIVAMVGVGVVAYSPFRWTPSVVPASAPAEVFSAERAMVDLRAVASIPRSMGTAEHAAAIEKIQTRLAVLGVESEVVEAVSARADFGQVFAGRIRNVIARIPGTDSTGAVLMMSHFDSLPTSMNANDGGLGVATVLEAVRA